MRSNARRKPVPIRPRRRMRQYLQLDPAKRSVGLGGVTVVLTASEFRLLNVIAEQRGQVVTKDMLLEALYPDQPPPAVKIIDVFVCKIRSKFRVAGLDERCIATIWGQGYALGQDPTQAEDEERGAA